MKTLYLIIFTFISLGVHAKALRLPEDGALFGAYVDAGPLADQVNLENINKFEQQIEKKLSWVYFSNNWLDGKIEFPSKNVETCKQASRVPYIRLMPWSTMSARPSADPIFTMDAFLEGRFDMALKNWALEAKAAETHMIIEFGPEVNGNWFPWNGQWNSAGRTQTYGDPMLPDGPEKFRDVYRRIIDIFRANEVNNVTWVFHVDTARLPYEWWNKVQYYYPGDDYIDWLGLSVFGAQLPSHNWIHFLDKMDFFWSEIRFIASKKPLIISEFAVIEDKFNAQRKAMWVEDTFNLVEKQTYPIKAMTYWNSPGWLADGSADFRVDSSPQSLEIFIQRLKKDFWRELPLEL